MEFWIRILGLCAHRRKRRWPTRASRAGLLALAWITASTSVGLGASREVSKEYEIKAAFLYNFTKFVEWRAGQFADSTESITIAVCGPNPFGDELQKIVKDRQVKGRQIVVKFAASAGEVLDAELAFIGAIGEERVAETVQTLNEAGIVTVGETREFAEAGGMIVFVLEGDKVRFEIEVGEAERRGLKISAQLQKLAKTVRRAR